MLHFPHLGSRSAVDLGTLNEPDLTNAPDLTKMSIEQESLYYNEDFYHFNPEDDIDRQLDFVSLCKEYYCTIIKVLQCSLALSYL